ncbi:MAG: hypothetical protein EWM73_00505 [Nitrospira sp.]|nr:MAG: hypothetical protein EWM73_00505 [Nitrospira sp.]
MRWFGFVRILLRGEGTMTRFILLLLAAFILACQPLVSEAGDVFTGFQIDNRSQYFGYLGVRTPILRASGGPDFFVQAMTAGLGYNFKTNGQILDANVQFIVPSLGITKTLGGWALSALAGPQLRRIEEQRLNASSTTTYQAGVYGQLEAFYWHEKWNLLAIGSYADLDNFFWSRLRGKVLAFKPEKSCCATYVGWDVTGMGNADFRAVMTGPVVEVQVEKVFLLARGGYQNSNTFHSGTYGGFEIYFPF